MLEYGRQFASRLRQTYTEWSADEGPLMAAAVAYYTALSFFPLMLTLVSGLGFFLAYAYQGQDAEQIVVRIIGEQTSPEMQQQLAAMLNGVRENAGFNGPIGVATLLLAVIAIFAQFEQAFDRIWNVASPATKGVLGAVKSALWDRFRAFLILLGLGLLVVLIFFAGLILTTARQFTTGILPSAEAVWNILQILVSIGLNTVAFALIYALLPKQPVQWREGGQGGFLAAVTWEIGRQLLAAFVIGKKYSAYGVIGSFIALMLWVYYACWVLFFWAEYVQILCQRCRPKNATNDSPASGAA